MPGWVLFVFNHLRWKAKGVNVDLRQKTRRAREAARARTLEERIADGEGGEKTLEVSRGIHFYIGAQIRLVRASPPSKEYEETKNVEFLLYEKYQKMVNS